MKAHGIEAWQKARRVEFTFEVQSGTKVVMSARHVWDRVAGTDTVTHDGVTVTVSLDSPPERGTPEAKAYARWVNDSYWLIAPLKLADPGTTTEDLGEQDFEGNKVRVLQLSFQGVGLTPGDRYHLYVDPHAHLVVGWVYMPNADKKVSARWLDTKSFAGVSISQTRSMGDRAIVFKDVRIE